jgi:hypothetical protein
MAEKTVTLPSGNTAVFRDPDTLKVKDRKKILMAIGAEDLGLAQGLKLVDGLLAMIIKEWSFDLIIPSVKIDSLDELSIPDYDALTEAAADAQKKLFPNFSDDGEADSPKDN